MSSSTTSIAALDLTQRPPRSPHVRLGGYVILPRLLDKGRAHLAGKVGAYVFNSNLDRRFFSFVKIDSQTLLDQLATGLSDTKILAWIQENAGAKREDWEIAAWSASQLARTATTVKARDHFSKELAKLAPDRSDVVTAFDFLDLDDYISFGGQA